MAFVHDQSCECLKSELDLFSVPPTQTSIENGSWVEYHPLSTLTDGSPIEYEICGSGEDYLDFANSYLHVVAKVTKANGENLDANEAVGPVNLFLHSLFSQIDISLNGTQITPATNTYPYRAMIETLLSYGGDAKESQLTSALFYKDQAGRMDVANLAEATRNEGFFKRVQFSKGSNLVDMMGRIHADIFFQERYMLNEVNTKIKLIRSKDVFSLMGTAGHTVKIVSAVLLVRKVKLSPSVFLAHAKALERTNAKYPIRRVVCKTFTVPAGFLDVSHEKLFSGQLPTRMVVGIVRNDAFNGALGRNPFNFHHFGLNEIGVYVDGQQQQSIRPLHPNFENGQYISSYVGLFSGTGKLNKDDGNNIERSDYANGYALYAFDLSPDLAEDDHFNLSRQGGVRLILKFAAALEVTVTVVAYAEFENVVEIDRNRNVVYDFSS
jgi:hypothetical protein